MRARIYNYWFGVSTSNDKVSKFQKLLEFCDNNAINSKKASPNMSGGFKLKELINLGGLENGMLYLYPTYATVWKVDIEYVHLVQSFLERIDIDFRMRLNHVEVRIESDSNELSPIYEKLTNIFEQSLVRLEDPPEACDLIFLSSNHISLSIKIPYSPLSNMDFSANAQKSTIWSQVGNYKSYLDEISLSTIQNYCREVGSLLAEELETNPLFSDSNILKFLYNIEFLPSKALVEFTKKHDYLEKSIHPEYDSKNTGAYKIIPFLRRYYPHLTIFDALSGTHTIIQDQEERIIRIPIIDLGFDLETVEIKSLDLSQHIPKLGFEDRMNLDVLVEIHLTKLILKGIHTKEFPLINNSDLQELVILDSVITNLDYDLRVNLPNLKRLYLDCGLTSPSYFKDWNIIWENREVH